ncbi:MAG TPA: hypothetical protein PLV06_03755 [Bacteroidales bacterium]|nr:hypothetical protein [Bacteroidales bacterium]HPF02128.1 hypothetical protein [Bacteroidales bacterium]HPJ58147.1 hypothetical protein [Bacteroidales bacterium]HPR11478.1 hypothetical protein [Bacteroidales bacterium]HRW84557.1 hypothetical protein [Bacteroidales bacterium]
MPYPKFDRDRLVFRGLTERKNRVDIEKDNIRPDKEILNLTEEGQKLLVKTAARIKQARENGSSVMLSFGAHLIKNGLSPVLIALMKEGWLTHLATNGAGIIHDWEFAFQGKSSEDVRENVEKGQFGLWEETGLYINLALAVGAYEGLGYGESIGKMIYNEGLSIPSLDELRDMAVKNVLTDPVLAASATDLAGVISRMDIKAGFMKIPHPFKEYSAQAAAWKLGIPFTGHPMIGHDIIYCHPANNCAAIGRTAQNDFLSFADSVSRLDHGVYMSVGSAVMSPMIFEKSLSMAQNIKIRDHDHIDDHYMLIADLAPSEWDWHKNGEPPADDPAYYIRFCKTFSRMGGEMDYLMADNRDFLPALYKELNNKQA